jgi:hypothetical protein
MKIRSQVILGRIEGWRRRSLVQLMQQELPSAIKEKISVFFFGASSCPFPEIFARGWTTHLSITVPNTSGRTSTLPDFLAATKRWTSDRVTAVMGDQVETKKEGPILLRQVHHRVVEIAIWHPGFRLTLFLHSRERCVSFNDCRNVSSCDLQNFHPCDKITSLLLNMVIHHFNSMVDSSDLYYPT